MRSPLLPEQLDNMNKDLPILPYWRKKGGSSMWRIIKRYFRRRRLLSARMRDFERDGMRFVAGRR